MFPDALPGFLRGDANGDGIVDIADAQIILGFLFLGDPSPVCLEAADTNADGGHDLADGVNLLSVLFQGGDPLPFPGNTECGLPQRLTFGCEENRGCR